MPGASTTRSAGIASCPRERWRKAPTRRSAASTSDHRPGTDLGAVRRHRPHRQRAPAAVLRAREVHERVDRAALEHRWRAAPVRPRRPRAARPGDRDGAHLRARLAAEVPELPVVTEAKLLDRPGVAAVDPTHPLIETWPVGLTGFEADDWIRDQRQVDIELADHRRVMPLVTFAHGIEDADRLVQALRDLVDAKGRPGDDARLDLPRRPELRTEQVMTPRDAFFAKTELVKPKDAAGRISAELVTPYPPGIPAAVPGERYTEAIVDYVEQIAAVGGYLEGAADPSLDRLRVVAG